MATLDANLDASGEVPPREKRMTLGQHFVELRRRLMICAAAVLLGMIGAFIATDWVIHLLMMPINTVRAARGHDFMASLNFQGITSAFHLKLQISFALGLLLAAPVWLWQVWAFVMPALTKKEIRYTVGFIAAAVPLFFSGVAVGIWVAPHVIEVMASFLPEGTTLFLSAMEYYDLILKLLLVIGVAFVLPVFLVALNMAGVISGKDIIRSWRIAVLASTLFAAIATPAADAVSMLILAGILILLYFLSALLALVLDKRRSKHAAAILEDDLPV